MKNDTEKTKKVKQKRVKPSQAKPRDVPTLRFETTKSPIVAPKCSYNCLYGTAVSFAIFALQRFQILEQALGKPFFGWLPPIPRGKQPPNIGPHTWPSGWSIVVVLVGGEGAFSIF
jgi:hypothetical protein